MRLRAMRRRAFTLVEMLLVVTIIGIATSVVAYSARGSITAVQIEVAQTQLKSLDHLTREQAWSTRSERVLVVSSQRDTVRASESNRVVTLPISRLLVGDAESKNGQRSIVFHADGSSETYAVGIGRTVDTSEWLVVVGGTGQTLDVRDAAEARRLVRLVR